MSIARATPPAPFGGAELKETRIRIETFRSSELRMVFCDVPVYKHCTPNGVKSI